MPEYITGINTDDGVKQIDYNHLANKPTSDTTLAISGGFADAAVTGYRISSLEERADALDGEEGTIAALDTRITALDGEEGAVSVLEANISELSDGLSNHSSIDIENEDGTVTEYEANGAATTESYGHVKLSDEFGGIDAYPDAAPGVALSLADGMSLSSATARTNHASSSVEHGLGTELNFGHVRLSDSTADSDMNVECGTAATPKAVNDVYTLANDLKTNLHSVKTVTIPSLESDGTLESAWVHINVESGHDYLEKDLFTTDVPGLYIIDININYYHNPNGSRHAELSTQLGGMKVQACTSDDMQTQMYINQCVYLPANNTVKLKLQQDSGNTLECAFIARYTCIPMPESEPAPDPEGGGSDGPSIM